MSLDPLTYLETVQASLEQGGVDQECLALVAQMRDQYSHRWWHEVSTSMLKVFKYPFARQAAPEFHKYVASPIRLEMSAENYTKIVYVAVQQMSADGEKGTQEAMELLDSAISAMIAGNSPQGRRMIMCLRALLMMANGPSLEAKHILDDVAEYLLTLQPHQIEPVLQAVLSKAQCRQCELTSDFTNFYSGVFLMMSHCERADLVPVEEELAAIAYKTALAALLSAKVFSFGELLSKQSLVDRLTASSSEKWILDFVQLCNSGQVAKAGALLTQAAASTPELSADLPELQTKIRLMGLLHLVFNTRADSRVFTFADIAQKCQLEEKDVEVLVLKALAKKLIEGRVDGLEGTVTVTWVQPRVVDKGDIQQLAKRVGEWREVVKTVIVDVAKMADEIPA